MDHNLSVRKFVTAVIDGANEDLVYFIQSTIDEVTNEKYGKSNCLPLDESKSSMRFIETITDPNTYETIRYVIGIALPEKCLFDYTA